jgi:hypothetical protein
MTAPYLDLLAVVDFPRLAAGDRIETGPAWDELVASMREVSEPKHRPTSAGRREWAKHRHARLCAEAIALGYVGARKNLRVSTIVRLRAEKGITE